MRYRQCDKPKKIFSQRNTRGVAIQESTIEHAKALWITPEGYKQRMEWIYLYNGECLPDQLTQDCAD